MRVSAQSITEIWAMLHACDLGRFIYIVTEKDIIIEITDEGVCMAVWDDRDPLAGLGDVQVTRLSDVEYDNERQGWEVTFRNGVKLPGLYKKRIMALNAEITYVEDHFSEFGEWIRTNHPDRVVPAPYVDPSMS